MNEGKIQNQKIDGTQWLYAYKYVFIDENNKVNRLVVINQNIARNDEDDDDTLPV